MTVHIHTGLLDFKIYQKYQLNIQAATRGHDPSFYFYSV